MIQVRDLTKNYSGHTAVSRLSFSVERGRVCGFLGPNGAGKSTTLNILAGCLAPSSGQVLINGHDILDEPLEARRHLGYLPEQPPLYPDMTVREYLHFVAEMKGLERGERRSQTEEAMERCGIGDVANRLIRQLSKGYQQRTGLAQALLGRPDILLLDEPTVGLDPRQITEIRALIRRLGEEHTVLFSSHILSEVQALCDEVIILSRGRLVAMDTPENLEKRLAGGSTLELVVKAEGAAVEEAVQALPEVRKLSCTPLEDGRTAVRIVSGSGDISEEVFTAFSRRELPIVSMTHNSAGLEDVFLELTAGEAETEEASHESDL